MGDDSQKLTEWIPSAKQMDLLNAAKEPGLKRSITAICKSADVSRVSFYGWMREDPGFRSAWASLAQESVRLHLPGVVAAMVTKAQGGSVGAARLLAEVEGLVRKRLEVTGRDGGPVRTIDLAALTQDQLDALITLDPALRVQLGMSAPSGVLAEPAPNVAPLPRPQDG